MITKQQKKYYIGVLLAVFGAVFFAGKAVIVKYCFIHYKVDTIGLLALRMLFSAPLYLIVLWLEPKKNLTNSPTTLQKKDWFYVILAGTMGYYLASFFDFWGLQYVTAGIERLVLFVYPTIVVLLGAIVFRKKITRNQYIALFITYLGVFLAFFPEIFLTHKVQKNLFLGSFLVFLSAFTYAVYLVVCGKVIPKFGTIRFTCYAMLVSTVLILTHHSIVNTQSLGGYESNIYLFAILMAVVCTVIPSFMITEAIKRIGSSNTSIIGSIGPITTIVLAVCFLDETFDIWQILGTITVVCGVLLISLSKK
ncbi:MAG: DMT family transporter [Pseudarcicella sp.]|nr:DMT family transporter [Pseudarcicella sp.]MBP6410611.1 DMT family transporter [Pseudarcicella sp.]